MQIWSPVWPDWAKFHHFGWVLKVFWQFSMLNFVFGKSLKRIWQILNSVSQFFISCKWPKMKNNQAIWSQWILNASFNLLVRKKSFRHFRTFLHQNRKGGRAPQRVEHAGSDLIELPAELSIFGQIFVDQLWTIFLGRDESKSDDVLQISDLQNSVQIAPACFCVRTFQNQNEARPELGMLTELQNVVWFFNYKNNFGLESQFLM